MLERFFIVEHGASAQPNGYTISTPNMLTKFNLCLNGMFISIPSFVIATHRATLADLRHQRPYRIAVIERATDFTGQYTALPYTAICRGSYFCR